jgi:hypothetical protein
VLVLLGLEPELVADRRVGFEPNLPELARAVLLVLTCEVLVKNQSKLVRFRNFFGMPHPEGTMADRSDAPQGQ